MENTNKINADKEKKNALNSSLDAMLENADNVDCSSGVCVIKGDKSLVERINKKIITEDGRQLLF
jgi:hypothetical protein